MTIRLIISDTFIFIIHTTKRTLLIVTERLTNSSFVEGTRAPRHFPGPFDHLNPVSHSKESESSMNNEHMASEPAGPPRLHRPKTPNLL